VDSGSDDGAVTSLWPGTTGTLHVVGTRAGPPSNPTSPGTTIGMLHLGALPPALDMSPLVESMSISGMLHLGTPSTALDMSPLVDAAEVLTCPLAFSQVLLAERSPPEPLPPFLERQARCTARQVPIMAPIGPRSKQWPAPMAATASVCPLWCRPSDPQGVRVPPFQS
jgi:hypothetical protein